MGQCATEPGQFAGLHPSNHQADNLVEAVELYEAVLEARDRDIDPLGRARVLANQGNVLAHLGVFDQPRPSCTRPDSSSRSSATTTRLRTVRGVLDEIARHTALNRTDDTGQEKAHDVDDH